LTGFKRAILARESQKTEAGETETPPMRAVIFRPSRGWRHAMGNAGWRGFDNQK